VQSDDAERQGVTAWLQALAHDLRAGRDRPPPVRRVDLPPADGRERPLGMPTVRDRVVPPACPSVRKPRGDAHFPDPSAGFRAQRSATPVVKVGQAPRISHGYVVAVASDRVGAPIDPELRRRRVARRSSERRVCKRLRQWRKAGVVAAGPWHPTTRGSPQGGGSSPVLATRDWPVRELYWTPQDRARGHLTRDAAARLLVWRTRGAAAHARHAVTPVVQLRTLTGPPTQTRLVDVQRAGCEVRGCRVHPGRARTSGTLSPLSWPGPNALNAIRRPMRAPPERRGVRGTGTALVANPNPRMRGWRHSCRVGHATTTCQDLDRDGRQRVGPWERARRQRAATAGPLQALRRPSGRESCSARGRGGTRACTPLEDGGRTAVGGRTARTV